MRVTVLGSGGGPDLIGSRPRCGTSLLVDIDGELLMFDCGRLAAEQAAEAGYTILDVKRLFFTHLHSGHTTGYPDFVLSSWNGGLFADTPGRADPLQVYGPAGTSRLTTGIAGRNGAFQVDLIMRVYSRLAWREYQIHRHRRNLEWPAVHVTEIASPVNTGVVTGTDRWQVRAASVSHGGRMPCLAYRVDAGGRAVVFCPDACPSPLLVALARGCDLLVHDGAWLPGQLSEPGRRAMHTACDEAGTVARSAGADRLVICSVPAVNDDPGILSDIRTRAIREFGGDVTVAEDLMVCDLS